MLNRHSIVLNQRERLPLHALADDTTANAPSANTGGHRTAFRLFNMHSLEIDEVMPFADAGRLAAVTTEVFGLPTLDLGVASASDSIAHIALPTHDVHTFFKRKSTQRLTLRGGSILLGR